MLVKIKLQRQTTFVNSLAKLTGLNGKRLCKNMCRQMVSYMIIIVKNKTNIVEFGKTQET
jgi:hypothetical protein